MQKILDDVYYVGVCNPTLRIFDIIMETKYGTTYNAYLIKDKHNTLIEAVYGKFTQDYLQKISEIVPLSSIEYLICNHTEPDHTGSIMQLLNINPNITVIASASGIKNIGQIINKPFKFLIAKDGDILEIGENKLQFISAPNLHWPDSMFTFIENKQLIFTCDFLGTHYGEVDIIDTELKYPEKFEEVIKDYYDAIFHPFRKWVNLGLDKIQNLKLKMIATSHGPILTKYIDDVMRNYRKWSKDKIEENSAVIIYVSAYSYTKYMAEALKKSLESSGIHTKIFDVIYSDIDEIINVINNSKLLLFGSPTINRDALKPMWDVMSRIDAVSNKGKPAFTFGSFGWSGEACPNMEARLLGLSIKIPVPSYKVNFAPSVTDFEKLNDIAHQLADIIQLI